MKTNNNCTCIIGSNENKCLVHGLIGGSDVGNEKIRVFYENDQLEMTRQNKLIEMINSKTQKFYEPNFKFKEKMSFVGYGGYGIPYKKVEGMQEDTFVLKSHPDPNDLSILTEPTPEQEIKHLEQVILSQQEKIVELTKQNKILNNQLFGYLKSTHY